MQNIILLAPSQSPEEYAVRWVETITAAWGFHNISHTYDDDWKSVWQQLSVPDGPQACPFCRNQLLNLMQNEDIWYPLSLVNRMLYFRERHSLLLECFIAYHWCIRMIERAPGSIDEPLMVIIMSFLPKDTLKFHAKYHTFGTLSEHEIICCDVSRDNHCCLGVS